MLRGPGMKPVYLLACITFAFAPRLGAEAPVAFIADQNGCKTPNPKPEPNERILWSGGCKDGWMDGQGTLEWYVDNELESAIQTTMLRGRATGFTKLNAVRDKFVLEAEFVNGKAHGYGASLSSETGQRYVGDFSQGRFHGLGTVYFPTGIVKQGQFKDGQLTGFMTETQPNGIRLSGVAVEALFEGPVTQVSPSGVRVDYLISKGQPVVGSPCRYTDANGASALGRLGKGGRDCKLSRATKLADFLQSATGPVSAAAIAGGYAGFTPGSSDPYAFIAHVAQMQAAALQAQQVPGATTVPATQQPSSSASDETD